MSEPSPREAGAGQDAGGGQAPAPARLPDRRALWIVLGGLGALAALAALLWVNGTRPDAAPRDPAPGERPTAQLLRGEDGHLVVRSALVVERPAADVFAVLTAYERFPEVFRGLWWDLSLEAVERQGEASARLRGRIDVPLRAFPIDVVVHHARGAAGFAARWDASSDDAAAGGRVVNRGSWEVRPLGPARSLLVYTLEVRQPGVPAFLVTNVVLAQVRPTVDAVRRALDDPR